MSNSQTLFIPSPHPHEAIDFPSIKNDDFKPALAQALEEAKGELQKIKDNTEQPNFFNTFSALEFCDENLSKVLNVFNNYMGLKFTPEIDKLSQEIYPQVSLYHSEVTFDEKLFKKLSEAYQNEKESSSLNTEQHRLMEVTYSNFVRNGAKLPEDKKKRLKEISQELAKLSPQFAQNVITETNQYKLTITDSSDLKGLPERVIESAKKTGDDGSISWEFTLQAPSLIPFLMHCENRELRKELYRAFSSRCTKGETSNLETLLKITNLRHEKAQLLGFKTHAEYVLTNRMAQTPEKVLSFLEELLPPSKKAADKELKELEDFAQQLDGIEKLEAWDLSFYKEKLKKKLFDLDSEEIKPYFSLEKVIHGVFLHIEKLYQVSFKELKNIPTYHEDVRTYEVLKSNGEHIGLFYLDLFPRETKQSGAWMSSFRDQGLQGDKIKRPHVLVSCNFPKPTESFPSLLDLRDVETLFHEFGHALHGLFANTTYPSLSGTNVYWDFVELPSQIFENWIYEEESLKLFAHHYQTGETLPQSLIDKIKKSVNFFAGYNSLRQLQFGFLDMSWHHNESVTTIKDPIQHEHEALNDLQVFTRPKEFANSPSFKHIFSGGYSAGYYSYKWAEVLDADAFAFFKEKGIFNQDVAHSFKTHILEKGGTEHPMTLYKRFRGQEPDPKELLRRDGLL